MPPWGIGEVGDRAEALARTVRMARERVPFYRDLHDGVDSVALADLPTCTKADLRSYGLFPLSASPLEEAYRVCATSGTTGPRLFVGYSRRDWVERGGVRLAHRASYAGFGAGDVLLNTHGYGLWVGGPALDLLAQSSGAGLLPAGPGGVDRMLAWFEELPITGLSATPSFMRFLIEHAAGAGVDPASWGLRVGFIGGECASQALRREVVEALGGGFRWQELYGSTESGGPILGFSPADAPYGGKLLIDTEEFVVELLDLDDDVPVEPGALGEITITTPFREFSPILRYRTRDLTVELPGQGDEGFPAVESLRGRLDDAIKVRGALVYPTVIEEIVVERLSPGAEFRIEIDREPGRLDEITVVVEHEGSDRELGELRDELREAIVMRVEVRAVPLHSLERFAGKAKRVVDRRPAP